MTTDPADPCAPPDPLHAAPRLPGPSARPEGPGDTAVPRHLRILALRAVSHPPGTVLLAGASGRIRVVEPARRPGAPSSAAPADSPLVGRLLPASVAAVALTLAAPTPRASPGVPAPGPTAPGDHGFVAADRDGTVVWCPPSGPDPVPPATIVCALDLVLRALGSPTCEPAERPLALLDATWLDRCLALTAAASTPPSWPRLSRLHPLAHGRPLRPRALRRRRHDFDRDLDWSGVRRGLIDGSLAWARPSPELAAWLDEGSLARWVLAEVPEPDELLDALCVLVGDPVADDLRRALLPPGPHGPTLPDDDGD